MDKGKKKTQRKRNRKETSEIEPIEIRPAGPEEGTRELIKMAREKD